MDKPTSGTGYIREYDEYRKKYVFHQVEFLPSTKGWIVFRRIKEVMTQAEFDRQYTIIKVCEQKGTTL